MYSTSNNAWACGDDTDTTLTATEMQAMIEVMSLNLQNIPQVNGENVLLESSTLNPANIDASAVSDGQVLTVNGGVAGWGDASAGGDCTQSLINHSDGSYYVCVDCDTYSEHRAFH